MKAFESANGTELDGRSLKVKYAGDKPATPGGGGGRGGGPSKLWKQSI